MFDGGLHSLTGFGGIYEGKQERKSLEISGGSAWSIANLWSFPGEGPERVTAWEVCLYKHSSRPESWQKCLDVTAHKSNLWPLSFITNL